jgi:transcription elongation factor GreA
MAEKPVFLTAEGLAKLESELEYLRHTRRQQIADRINESKALGGTIDAADYEDAKNEQAFVEGRIQAIERIISNAELIEEGPASGVVGIGSRVTVTDANGENDSYVIVGSVEADPKSGRISNESPVGRALIGRKIGEEFSVMTPGGVITMKISEIN